MTGQGKKMDLKEQIYSVLVVSASENFNNALSALLPAFRYAPVRYVSGISAAKRILSERDFDFLILNSPLPDGPGTDLAIDFSSSSGGIALLIVRSDMLEGIRSKVTPHGVFTLSKPLSIEMFSAALDWMVSARERLRNSERKSLSFEEKMREIRLVNRAKWLLITELKMEEPQAHRYIEKQAMDRCVTRIEVAEEIINTYS